MAGAYTLSIPGWEQTQLVQLGAAGKLSGVDPALVGLIDQAESSGNPGSPNPEGYGGYFGLSTSQLPANPTSQASFDAQAETAAADFASYLSQQPYVAFTKGDPLKAEAVYQEGLSGAESGSVGSGVGIFKAAGVTDSSSPGNIVLAPDAGSTNASAISGSTGQETSGTQLQGVGAVLQEINNLMNPSGILSITEFIKTLGTGNLQEFVLMIFSRAVFTVGFMGAMYVGLKTLTSPGSSGSAIEIINQTTNAQARKTSAQANLVRAQAYSEEASFAGTRAQAQMTTAKTRHKTAKEYAARGKATRAKAAGAAGAASEAGLSDAALLAL